MSDIKQVIVMRKDLNMRKGKMIAQGAHASLAVFLNEGGILEPEDTCVKYHQIQLTNEMEEWITGLFTKVCLGINSEQELIAVYEKAKEAGLPCSLITDAGLTEFNGDPTITCCAIGPAKNSDIDSITGNLILL